METLRCSQFPRISLCTRVCVLLWRALSSLHGQDGGIFQVPASPIVVQLCVRSTTVVLCHLFVERRWLRKRLRSAHRGTLAGCQRSFHSCKLWDTTTRKRLKKGGHLCPPPFFFFFLFESVFVRGGKKMASSWLCKLWSPSPTFSSSVDARDRLRMSAWFYPLLAGKVSASPSFVLTCVRAWCVCVCACGMNLKRQDKKMPKTLPAQHKPLGSRGGI